MMILKKAEEVHSGLTRLEYTVKHSTPGREGTTLSAELYLNVFDDYVECSLTVPGTSGDTPKEALERMCAYLERLKTGIETRQDTLLPL